MIMFIHGIPTQKARCKDGPDGYACDVCREAARRYFQKAVDKRRALLAADFNAAKHGLVKTYRAWGCRCALCKQAATDERYKYGRTVRGEFRPPLQQRRAKPFGREWLDAADDA